MNYCTKCGCVLNTVSVCPNGCSQYSYISSYPIQYVPTEYAYKCPECKGEFNQPACLNTTSAMPVYRCPWCGFKMRGI